MGLLDYLFGERVDPEAAHNAALKGLLSTAQDTPIEPKNAFGLPPGQFPGTTGSPGFGAFIANGLKMPDLSAMREQTPLAPAGSNIPTIDPAPFPLVGRAFSEAWKDLQNEAAPPSSNVAEQFLKRRQADAANAAPLSPPLEAAGPWTTRVEDSPLAKTITAIENNPPAAAGVSPSSSQSAVTGAQAPQPPNISQAPSAPVQQPPGASVSMPQAQAGYREPNFFDMLGAFANAPSMFGGIAAAMGGRDPQQVEAMNATYQGLVSRGVTPDMARAAVLNPQLGAQVYARVFPELTDISTNIMGQPIKGWANSVNQTVTGLNGQPAGALQGPGGVQDVVQLVQTDPGFAADVKAFAQGREIPTGRPGPYQMAVRRAAQLIYNTDESTYQARANARKTMTPGGKWADMKVANNTAIGHLNDVNELGDKLHNVSGFGPLNNAINSAYNTYSEQRGTSPRDQALAAYEQAVKLATKEVQDYYIKGGGTAEERDALLKDLAPTKTPQQRHAAVANAVHMMSSKSKPMEDELNRIFAGTGERFQMVEPENQAKVDAILKSAGQPPMFGTQSDARFSKDQLNQFATEAIAKGADPKAVMQRYQSLGLR